MGTALLQDVPSCNIERDNGLPGQQTLRGLIWGLVVAWSRLSERKIERKLLFYWKALRQKEAVEVKLHAAHAKSANVPTHRRATKKGIYASSLPSHGAYRS